MFIVKINNIPDTKYLNIFLNQTYKLFLNINI